MYTQKLVPQNPMAIYSKVHLYRIPASMLIWQNSEKVGVKK